MFWGDRAAKGGSYKTNVDWDAILDENGKLRLSLGLYAPDTITGLGKTGEGYHTHENYFWTGFQGDPSKGKPADQSWYGMSNLVVDRTGITSLIYTSFNTGHGKRWFVMGKSQKTAMELSFCARFLPTWRWWIRHAEGSALRSKDAMTLTKRTTAEVAHEKKRRDQRFQRLSR